jgi:hypothetical protein
MGIWEISSVSLQTTHDPKNRCYCSVEPTYFLLRYVRTHHVYSSRICPSDTFQVSGVPPLEDDNI